MGRTANVSAVIIGTCGVLVMLTVVGLLAEDEVPAQQPVRQQVAPAMPSPAAESREPGAGVEAEAKCAAAMYMGDVVASSFECRDVSQERMRELNEWVHEYAATASPSPQTELRESGVGAGPVRSG